MCSHSRYTVYPIFLWSSITGSLSFYLQILSTVFIMQLLVILSPTHVIKASGFCYFSVIQVDATIRLSLQFTCLFLIRSNLVTSVIYLTVTFSLRFHGFRFTDFIFRAHLFVDQSSTLHSLHFMKISLMSLGTPLSKITHVLFFQVNQLALTLCIISAYISPLSLMVNI